MHVKRFSHLLHSVPAKQMEAATSEFRGRLGYQQEGARNEDYARS